MPSAARQLEGVAVPVQNHRFRGQPGEHWLLGVDLESDRRPSHLVQALGSARHGKHGGACGVCQELRSEAHAEHWGILTNAITQQLDFCSQERKLWALEIADAHRATHADQQVAGAYVLGQWNAALQRASLELVALCLEQWGDSSRTFELRVRQH